MCDSQCLVDLHEIQDATTAKFKIKDKINEIILKVEEGRGGKIENFKIDTTFLQQESNFDPMNPATWKKKSIKDEWDKASKAGMHGLIVLAAISKETVPRHCPEAINQKEYSMALDQMLLHDFLLHRPIETRLLNESFFVQKGKSGCKAYVLYMTLKIYK